MPEQDHDSDELGRLKERLRQAERRNRIYQTILHATTDGFLVVDRQGLIEEINQAYCDFYAVKSEDVLGKPVHSLIKNSKMLEIMDTGQGQVDAIHVLLKNQSASGERVTATTRMPVFSEEGETVAGVALIKFSNYTNKLVKSLQELGDEVEYYKKELLRHSLMEYTFDAITTVNPRFQEVKLQAERYAANDLPMLLHGETGVGKEVFANAVHHASERRNGPFICINCTSIPADLLESELFGYEGGTFTGSRRGGKKGKFELADKGTLLLDEIGDMPLRMQAKLLRVLQDNMVEKIGSEKPVKVDVRILSATNKNLEQMIGRQLFREDLYYRLNVLPVLIPPLREHAEDIPGLTLKFIEELVQKYGRRMDISKEAMELMRKYSWPGNIRALKNAVGRAFMTAEGSVILPRHLPSAVLSGAAPAETADSVSRLTATPEYVPFVSADEERAMLLALLQHHDWNCVKTAKALGVHRATIYNRMKKLNICIHTIRRNA